MNVMNGSLKGRVYEVNSREESLQGQEEDRTYKVAFERDLRETNPSNRNYVELKRN